uniref:Transmembrane protein n=1 Tax=Anopheles maculatus TaxID=74869 RepID=A0A182SCP2_9DIPT
MTGGRIPQPARMTCTTRPQRPAGRSLLSRRFFANHLSATVPIVLLLLAFCSDFAYLSGDSDGGGVLADEVTTAPPEETWTTSSNENVGTGEAAPFGKYDGTADKIFLQHVSPLAKAMINDKSPSSSNHLPLLNLFHTIILLLVAPVCMRGVEN